MNSPKSKKINPPLRVEHESHRGRWCFLVESSKTVGKADVDWRKDAHRVDLEYNPLRNGASTIYNGGCDCPNFRCVRQKIFDNERRVSRCKHIKAAVYAVANELIAITIENERRRDKLFKFFTA